MTKTAATAFRQYLKRVGVQAKVRPAPEGRYRAWLRGGIVIELVAPGVAEVLRPVPVAGTHTMFRPAGRVIEFQEAA